MKVGSKLATFTCWECGNCCRIPGYVHLTDDDLEALARQMACTVTEFTERYATLTRDRRGLTLREEPDGACVFLKADGGCQVYAARPQQCRDFPYKWRYPGWEKQCENTCALPANKTTANERE